MAAVPPPAGMTQAAWDLAIRARADNILTSAGITPDSVILIDNLVAYDPVSVTVNYTFPAMLAGFIPGLDNIPLSSTTTMRREY